MKFHIYSLLDQFGQTRYIGVTIWRLSDRLTSHLQEARDLRSQTHKSRWIRGMFASDLTPTICLLEATEDRNREVYWIARCRAEGCPLTNLTAGGEGTVGYKHSEASKLKMSLAKKGQTRPAALVKQTADKLRGRKHSQEFIDRRAAAMQGVAKTGATAKGHTKPEATRLKMSQTWKRIWQERKAA